MAVWFRAQNSALGVQVHADTDASWFLHQGMAWANCVANVMFDSIIAMQRHVLTASCVAIAQRSVAWASGSVRLRHLLT